MRLLELSKVREKQDKVLEKTGLKRDELHLLEGRRWNKMFKQQPLMPC